MKGRLYADRKQKNGGLNMKLKRTVSVILAFLMIMGMIPLSAMAAGSPETYGISDGESAATGARNAARECTAKG